MVTILIIIYFRNMILVTGGTGLVGSHLLYKLVNEGHTVKAIYRTESSINKTKHVFSYYLKNYDALFNKIQWVPASLNDVPALEDAFKNVTLVYHCAALISFDPKDYYKLRKTNIEGTANIVNLCLSYNVKKLCYVSSIAALGTKHNNTLIKEDTPWNPELDNTVYAISKYGAEMEVWRGTQEGLNAVILNPGVIIGPGFWFSGIGIYIKKTYHFMPYYATGTTGYVDVLDVVKCMTLLMEFTIKNQNYICIAENWSFKDFIYKVAQYLQVKPPKRRLTKTLLNIAWRLDWVKQKLTGKPRIITKQTAVSALSKTTYDNSKIKTELKVTFMPIEDSIKSSCNYFLKDKKTT